MSLLAAILAFLALATPAFAQTYPAKPIRMIVPFAQLAGVLPRV
jgi:tripartite-type tricarboxylate transporter receptor subunit TctC